MTWPSRPRPAAAMGRGSGTSVGRPAGAAAAAGACNASEAAATTNKQRPCAARLLRVLAAPRVQVGGRHVHDEFTEAVAADAVVLQVDGVHKEGCAWRGATEEGRAREGGWLEQARRHCMPPCRSSGRPPPPCPALTPAHPAAAGTPKPTGLLIRDVDVARAQRRRHLCRRQRAAPAGARGARAAAHRSTHTPHAGRSPSKQGLHRASTAPLSPRPSLVPVKLVKDVAQRVAVLARGDALARQQLREQGMAVAR